MNRNDPALIEECQLRAQRFWSHRHMFLAWPIEPSGYTFLGNVVHRVGAAIFPGWTGLEPEDLQAPELKRAAFKTASPIQMGFAGSVLEQYDAANFPQFRETILARLNNGQPMLKQAEWDRAKEFFLHHLDQRYQLAGYRMSAVMRAIVEAAAQQKLSMATRLSNGVIVASPPNDWATEWAYSRFTECQMNPAAPFVKTLPGTLHGIALAQWQVDLLPGNEWLFVETNSLESFVASLSNVEVANPRTASAPNNDHAAPDTNGAARSAYRDAISLAVQELWNGSVPVGITVGQRNTAIVSFLKKEEKAIPSDKTIARYFKDNSRADS